MELRREPVWMGVAVTAEPSALTDQPSATQTRRGRSEHRRLGDAKMVATAALPSDRRITTARIERMSFFGDAHALQHDHGTRTPLCCQSGVADNGHKALCPLSRHV